MAEKEKKAPVGSDAADTNAAAPGTAGDGAPAEEAAARNDAPQTVEDIAPPVEVRKKKKSFFRNKWFKRGLIVLIIAALVSGYMVYRNNKEKKAAEAEATSKTAVVSRGDITVKITGSGTVEPIETYNIVPTVSGTIDADFFEEGDYVEEGAVLYKFDSTVADNAIRTAENSIKTAENSIKTAENSVKSSENSVKTAENSVRTSENAVKTAENSVKSTQNSVVSAQNNVDKAKMELQNRADDITRAKDNIAKLAIYANSTGKVSDLALTVGNDAGSRICTITDTQTMLVKIPFNAAQFRQIAVGDSATVNIEQYMTSASATVVRKYDTAGTGADGSVAYDVELQLGGAELPAGTYVSATVNTGSGAVTSSQAGTVFNPDPTTVMAEVSGKVKEVYVRNGDWVTQGTKIAQLESTSLEDALKTAEQNYTSAQMTVQEAENSYQNALINLDNSQTSLDNSRTSLENSKTSLSGAQDNLENSKTSLDNNRTNLDNAQSNLVDRQKDAEDYTITAPISGVIMSKDYKAGDTIYGQNSTTLMVIADMTKMKFTISVDELDIARIAIGQEVEVTSDALEGVELIGRITNISKLGTAQNGVTNYPVEVTIDEPGDLMSGMNVSAEIIVGEVYNVVQVPVTAVTYFEGKHYVTVVGEVEGMTDLGADGVNVRPGGWGRPAENSAEPSSEGETVGKEAQDAAPGEAPSGENAVPMGGIAASNAAANRQSEGRSSRRGSDDSSITLYDEEQRVEVEVGLSNDDYYEIKSGLQVGQVVRDNGTGASSTNPFAMMMEGMGGGGPQGGGRPDGGGPGGQR